MIKNKNKIIVFVVFAFLIVGSLILINNKDLKISTVSSKGKKYNAVNPADARKNTAAQCNAWYDNIENQYVSYKDVVGETSNLFIVNHCAWNPYDISSGDFTDENKKTVCDMQKEFIKAKYISYSDAVNTYNASNCKGISGELTVSYEGKSCSALKTEIEKDFVGRYGDYVNYFVSNCKGEVGDIDKSKLKPYKAGESCESLKLVNSNGELYTGILEENGTVYGTKNQCEYPLFYIDGNAVEFYYYFNNNSNETDRKSACSTYKNFVENKRISDNDEVYVYNTYCGTYTENLEVKYKGKNCSEWKTLIEDDYVKYKWVYENIYLKQMKCQDIDSSKKYETVTTYFDATGSYGMNCNVNGVEYAVDTNICAYNLRKKNDGTITGTIDLPNSISGNDGKGIIQSGTYRKFIGWSRDKNCSSIDISQESIRNGIKSISVNNSNYVSYYYACFDQSDNGLVDDVTNIYNSCDSAGDTEPTLVNTVRTTKSYKTTGDENTSESVTKDGKYKINKYCDMKCTETFNYTYPSIFETVKSGTYFELLFTPQVNSTYTCNENFYYDLWKNDYNSAIENEKKAYVDYKNVDEIGSLTISSRSGHDAGGNYYIKYYASYTPFIYNSSDSITTGSKIESGEKDSEGEVIKELLEKTKSFSKSTIDSTKHLDEYGNSSTRLSEAKKNYENKVVERTKIEKMNNEVCYNSLSDTKIFTENFYDVDPKLKLSYDADKTISNEDKKSVSLKATPYYNKDALDRSNDTESITIKYGDDVDETFVAKKYTTITRTKKMNFNFNTEYDYYTEFYTGKISSGSGNIRLGNVFPVTLDSSGEKSISFEIEKNGLSTAIQEKIGDNTKYTCTYNISNDAVVLDKSTKTKSDAEKKYKTSFFVRPIATNDVDPNNRLDSGLLGANWASRKGQLLIKNIENKSKGNNTYNPNNLEYSFTLNAESLDKIRDYNKSHKYDEKIDTYFNCNGLGMECESKFLDDLLKGTYGSVKGNVNNGRKARKYYIGGKWYSTDSLLSNKNFVEISNRANHSKSEVYGVCNSSCKDDAGVCYECLYKKVNEGVLP